jgi:ABC-type sugar transport system substrate-binding protein
MNPYRLTPLHRLLIILTALLLAVAAASSVWLSIGLAGRMASAREIITPLRPEDRHVFVLLSNEDPHFRDAFLAGARKAAQDRGIALEIVPETDLGNAVAYGEAMGAAVASRVDGIIVQPAWTDVLQAPAEEAVREGIRLITVESELAGLPRDCHVGFNAFEFGTRAARLAVQASGRNAHLTVLYRTGNTGNDNHLIDAGMRDLLFAHPTLVMERVETESNAFFGAEDTIRGILTESPGQDLLVCTTARDTVAAAQTLLDLNRLNVQIVGTDLNPEIQSLLDKKLIYGTVVRSAEEIGRRSVESMDALLAGEAVSDNIDVPLGVVLAGG